MVTASMATSSLTRQSTTAVPKTHASTVAAHPASAPPDSQRQRSPGARAGEGGETDARTASRVATTRARSSAGAE